MPLLEISNLHKSFGTSVAVDSFQLEVERGEFVSFLGPSGCGKTTTLRMVAGFETPTSGRIVIDGADMTFIPPNQRNIGMVFQSYALFPNMSVADNIGFGLKLARHPVSTIRARVDELLQIIHMEEFARRYPYQLSGGQQQRVALARALAIRPKVLLLDEPLSALDAKIRASLRQEIRAIQRQLGITTIYVTHDQEEAMALSDRIVVMSRGQIEQIGTPFEVYNYPKTRFVAAFVGTLNILTATILNPTLGHVSVEGQAIRLGSALLNKTVGQPVTVAIRPERITSDATEAPGTSRLNGVVDDVTFLGALVRVRVRVGAQQIALDTFNTPELAPPRLGDTLTLSVPPDACLVLEDAGGEPVVTTSTL